MSDTQPAPSEGPAFTSADLAAVKAAISMRGSGKQVTDVQSGDRRIRYADTPMSELLALHDRMVRDLGSAALPAGARRPARAFRGTIGSGY